MVFELISDFFIFLSVRTTIDANLFIFLLFRNYQKIQMSYFNVTLSQLNDLFDLQSISKGSSLKKLTALGKVNGLQTLLKTRSILGRDDSPLDREMRIKAFEDNRQSSRSSRILKEVISESFFSTKQIIIYQIIFLQVILSFFHSSLEDQIGQLTPLLLILLIYALLRFMFIDYAKSKKVYTQLSSASTKTVKILRNGSLVEVSVSDILVGDVMKLKSGDFISVDGVLVQSFQLEVDESFFDKDRSIVVKQTIKTEDRLEDPFILSGSRVLKGEGLMIVLAVGNNALKYRSIALSTHQTKTQNCLNVLAQRIQLIGTVTAFTTAAFSIVNHFYHHKSTFWSINTLIMVGEWLIVALIIKAITLKSVLIQFFEFAYSYCALQMMKENILPLSQQAIEAIGFVDDICLHKSGLFTLNEMKVTRFFAQGKNFELEMRQALNPSTIRILGLSICNNSTATPSFEKQDEQLKTTYIGDKVQCSLLETAYKFGFDYHRFRQPYRQAKIFQFDSNRKMMATVYKDDNNSLFVFVKGAPELLLPYCTSFINSEGLQAQMTSQEADILYDIVEDYGQKTLHTILLAFKEVEDIPEDWDDVCHNLIVLAIFGIKDPLRKGSAEAVELFDKAGIRLRMVTGDNKKTAISIAREAGILSSEWLERDDDCTVMQGKEFREFVGGLVNAGTFDEAVGDIENFKKVQQQLRILARSSPEDKYLLIVGLKNLGRKVAFAANNAKNNQDRASILKADVGILKHINQADDQVDNKSLVLSKHNLTSITNAVRWSRIVPLSFRKILKFQINLILVTLNMIVIGTLHFGQSPLKLFHIIWTHLILSIFVGVAFAVEYPKTTCYSKHLEPFKEITDQLWHFIIYQAVLQTMKMSFFLFEGPELLGILPSFPSSGWDHQTKKHQTLFFNIFVMNQIFSSFSACHSTPQSNFEFRTLMRNRLLIIFILTAIGLQLLIIKIGGSNLGLTELSFKENIFCITLGISSLLPCITSQVLLTRVKSFKRKLN